MANYYIFSIQADDETLHFLSDCDYSPAIIATSIECHLANANKIPYKTDPPTPYDTHRIDINGKQIGIAIGVYYDSDALGGQRERAIIPPQSLVFIVQTGNLNKFLNMSPADFVEKMRMFKNNPDSLSGVDQTEPVFFNNQDVPYKLCAMKTHPIRLTDIHTLVSNGNTDGYWNVPPNHIPFRYPH